MKDVLLTNDSSPVLRKRVVRFFYSFMFFLIFLALTVLILVIYQTYDKNSPIDYESVDIVPIRSFCVGQFLSFNGKITTKEPVILYTYISVNDHTGSTPLWVPDSPPPPLPLPQRTTYHYHLDWRIPKLAPGNYVRVIGFRGNNGGQRIVFNSMLFSVKECDK